MDPWSRTSSPPADPWNSGASAGAIARPPMMNAGGSTSVEGWLSRTQSPSVASRSSNEEWLPNNGSSPTNSNGNIVGGSTSGKTDPWLSKPVPPPATDPWLNKPTTVADAWQPTAGYDKITAADPWGTGNNIGVSLVG